jgi:hypothetical protein
MSDYLTNIAAKALNLAPVVRPRLVSLFEPPTGMCGLPTGLEQGPDGLPDD